MQVNLNNQNTSFGAYWDNSLVSEAMSYYEQTIEKGDIKEIEEHKAALDTINSSLKTGKIVKKQTPYSDYYLTSTGPFPQFPNGTDNHTFQHQIRAKGELTKETVIAIAKDLRENHEWVENVRKENPKTIPSTPSDDKAMRNRKQEADQLFTAKAYINADKQTAREVAQISRTNFIENDMPQSNIFNSIRCLETVKHEIECDLEHEYQKAEANPSHGYQYEISCKMLALKKANAILNGLKARADQATKIATYSKPNIHVFDTYY